MKQIAAELETSERTIFRDLAVLELAGVPYYHDREDRCFRVRPGFQFPTLNLTDDELIGQATSTAITSAPGLDVTNGSGPTSRKLRATTREAAANLIDEVERVTSVLDLKLADHRKHHESIRTIQRVLIQAKKLTGTYRSPYQAKPKRVELHPYRLCLVQQAWYLIARPDESDGPQTYRVARFKTLRPRDSPSVVPDDFDLRTYFGNAWGAYRGDATHKVEVRFSREAADLVTETTWHSTQAVERHEDGSVSLHFVVDGLNEVVYWILGWSGRVAVIQPPELREMVLEHLRKALKLNRG